ncbi:hypothetical protein QO179_25000 [Bacillus stercoris]|nr:hypothetical protein [Bacillus stercoris]
MDEFKVGDYVCIVSEKEIADLHGIQPPTYYIEHVLFIDGDTMYVLKALKNKRIRMSRAHGIHHLSMSNAIASVLLNKRGGGLISEFKVGDHVYILKEKERCFNVEPTVYIISDVYGISDDVAAFACSLYILKPINPPIGRGNLIKSCFQHEIAHANMSNKIASNLLRKREICTLELSIGKHRKESR